MFEAIHMHVQMKSLAKIDKKKTNSYLIKIRTI